MSDNYKVLAIGNSFSQDATRLLHELAAASGVDMTVVNLYIGGCSLERHAENLASEDTQYLVEVNGTPTDKYTSVTAPVKACDWDFIVTQQSSHDSGWLDTYEPFASILFDYLKKAAPKAKLFLQQTWAYEINSAHPAFPRYNRDQEEMYRRSKHAYETVAKAHGLPLIPCGDIIQEVRREQPFDVKNGGQSLCRDGFHMHWLYGRYLLSAVWLRALTGIDVSDSYIPANPAVGIADKKLLKIIRSVIKRHFDSK